MVQRGKKPPVGCVYTSWETLPNLFEDDPSGANDQAARLLTSLVPQLADDGSWKDQFDAMTKLQSICKFHPKVLSENLDEVMDCIINCSNNLRSGVARNGLITTGCIALAAPSQLDDYIDRLVPMLVSKCANKAQKFLAEAAWNTAEIFCASDCVSEEIVTRLARLATPKNLQVAKTVASLLATGLTEFDRRGDVLNLSAARAIIGALSIFVSGKISGVKAYAATIGKVVFKSWLVRSLSEGMTKAQAKAAFDLCVRKITEDSTVVQSLNQGYEQCVRPGAALDIERRDSLGSNTRTVGLKSTIPLSTAFRAVVQSASVMGAQNRHELNPSPARVRGPVPETAGAIVRGPILSVETKRGLSVPSSAQPAPAPGPFGWKASSSPVSPFSSSLEVEATSPGRMALFSSQRNVDRAVTPPPLVAGRQTSSNSTEPRRQPPSSTKIGGQPYPVQMSRGFSVPKQPFRAPPKQRWNEAVLPRKSRSGLNKAKQGLQSPRHKPTPFSRGGKSNSGTKGASFHFSSTDSETELSQSDSHYSGLGTELELVTPKKDSEELLSFDTPPTAPPAVDSPVDDLDDDSSVDDTGDSDRLCSPTASGSAPHSIKDSPRPGGIESQASFAGLVEPGTQYPSWCELTYPFQDNENEEELAQQMTESLADLLTSTDNWRVQFEALTSVQVLCKFFPQILAANIHLVFDGILNCCYSLRSGVAKNALITVGCIATAAPSTLKPFCRQLVPLLVNKCGNKAQKFLADAAAKSAEILLSIEELSEPMISSLAVIMTTRKPTIVQTSAKMLRLHFAKLFKGNLPLSQSALEELLPELGFLLDGRVSASTRTIGREVCDLMLALYRRDHPELGGNACILEQFSEIVQRVVPTERPAVALCKSVVAFLEGRPSSDSKATASATRPSICSLKRFYSKRLMYSRTRDTMEGMSQEGQKPPQSGCLSKNTAGVELTKKMRSESMASYASYKDKGSCDEASLQRMVSKSSCHELFVRSLSDKGSKTSLPDVLSTGSHQNTPKAVFSDSIEIGHSPKLTDGPLSESLWSTRESIPSAADESISARDMPTHRSDNVTAMKGRSMRIGAPKSPYCRTAPGVGIQKVDVLRNNVRSSTTAPLITEILPRLIRPAGQDSPPGPAAAGGVGGCLALRESRCDSTINPPSRSGTRPGSSSSGCGLPAKRASAGSMGEKDKSPPSTAAQAAGNRVHGRRRSMCENHQRGIARIATRSPMSTKMTEYDSTSSVKSAGRRTASPVSTSTSRRDLSICEAVQDDALSDGPLNGTCSERIERTKTGIAGFPPTGSRATSDIAKRKSSNLTGETVDKTTDGSISTASTIHSPPRDFCREKASSGRPAVVRNKYAVPSVYAGMNTKRTCTPKSPSAATTFTRGTSDAAVSKKAMKQMMDIVLPSDDDDDDGDANAPSAWR